jgi:pimeloyl-ACP methyl ester carboxylesterase
MPHIEANGIEICYETTGDPADPPLLMIMGLGAQLVDWEDGFVEPLAERGHYVIRFDNRDIGLSQHFDEHRMSRVEFLRTAGLAFAGAPVPVPYGIGDMAADAAGLLDALGVACAHVVGASMGGMIAQQLAIDFPHKVRSLTSVMSTTGERFVGRPKPHVLPAMLTSAKEPTYDAVLAQQEAVWKVIATPDTYSTERVAERVRRNFFRSYHPEGMGRQMLAVLRAPNRAPGLRKLRMPTTVVHGSADPLVTPSGGFRTASLVKGSDLVMLGGHAHDLPTTAQEVLGDVITRTTRRAERPSVPVA